MPVNLLPWLLNGSRRPQYAAKQVEGGARVSLAEDFDVFLLCLLAIIAVRLAFNAVLSSAASRLAQGRGRDPAHKDGRKLLEEVWVLCGNLLMLSLAFFVMMKRNGRCWFGNVEKCIVGWPIHDIDPATALYYNLEMAWYGHLLLKPVLGYGLADGRDMMAHHCVSVALLMASYGLNLHRIGIVVLTLFGISNPTLHLAKLCNQLDIGILRVPTFALFAGLFFMTRVVLVPLIILIPGMFHSRQWVPYAVRDFHAAYVALNFMMTVMYALQLVWMRSILRVLRQAATAGADAASQLSAQVDPAKRYVAVHKEN